MRIFSQIVLLLCTFCLVQCGSVFAPKKQTITLRTSDPKTTIYLDNTEFGQDSSITGVLKKSKTVTVHEIKLELPGHKTSYQVLKPKGRYPLFWVLQAPHVLLFGIPTVIDLGTTTPHRYEKTTTLDTPLAIVLRAENQKNIDLYGIYIDWNNIDTNCMYIDTKRNKSTSLAINTAEEKYKQKNIAVLNKTMTRDLRQVDLGNCNFQVNEYLRKGNFIDTLHTVFKDESNSFELEGKIISFKRYSLKTKGYGPHFKAKTEVVWYLRNTYGERIDSITDASFSDERTRATNQELMQDAVENSYFKIMKSNQVQKVILREENFAFTDDQILVKSPENLVQRAIDASLASVLVKSKNGHGSGFAISNDGYILTNYHVISDGEYGPSSELFIVRPDGTKSIAHIIRFNKSKDIALLKVDTVFEKAFEVSDIKSYELYQDIYTIGAPKSTELGESYNYGLLSNERTTFNVDLIQLFMSVNAGNSGGPIFDKSGTLHGIVVSKLSGISTEGISFAIPSYKISEYLNITFN